jgi:hypothetical protein
LGSELTSVTATSRSDAWAVGSLYTGSVHRTLALHWNGKGWKRVTSPNASVYDNFLYGVAGTSSSNAWAVGSASDGSVFETLILHWNGTGWKRQPSSNVGDLGNYLYGVDSFSATNAWAVGFYYGPGPLGQNLALHCC